MCGIERLVLLQIAEEIGAQAHHPQQLRAFRVDRLLLPNPQERLPAWPPPPGPGRTCRHGNGREERAAWGAPPPAPPPPRRLPAPGKKNGRHPIRPGQGGREGARWGAPPPPAPPPPPPQRPLPGRGSSR